MTSEEIRDIINEYPTNPHPPASMEDRTRLGISYAPTRPTVFFHSEEEQSHELRGAYVDEAVRNIHRCITSLYETARAQERTIVGEIRQTISNNIITFAADTIPTIEARDMNEHEDHPSITVEFVAPTMVGERMAHRIRESMRTWIEQNSYRPAINQPTGATTAQVIPGETNRRAHRAGREDVLDAELLLHAVEGTEPRTEYDSTVNIRRKEEPKQLESILELLDD